MPGAIIAVDQDRPSGPSFGTPGVARTDLWRGHVVRPRCATTDNHSYSWVLLNVPPGSNTVITPGTETESACEFAPDSIDTCLLMLITNGGGPGNVQIMPCGVTFDEEGNEIARGWRIPATGERSWQAALRKIITDLRNGIIPGSGGFTVQTGGEDLPARAFLNLLGGLRGSDNEDDDSTDVELDFRFQIRVVTTSTAALHDIDCIVLVKRIVGSTLTLPEPQPGRTLIIVDASGINPSEGSINLIGNDGEAINGNSVDPYRITAPRVWALVTSDGTDWFAAQLSPTAAASGGASVFTYQLQSGVVSTALATAASKQAMGAVRFDPSVLQPGPGQALGVRFEAIIETSDAGRPVFVDLYDVAGATTIASSELTTSELAAAYVSVDLPDLVGVVPTTLQARLWMDPQDPGDVVSCSYAALVLTVS